MKKISILMVCLCVLFISHAQSIVIIDQNNLQPISGVKALLTSDNSSILGISDANGNLILPSKKDYGKLSISFEHTNYHTKVLSFNEIKQNNYNVFLTENINSLDEIVVSASKFEEKRKDVAQKIQVIRSSELQNMNQSSTADVIANSGNVMVQKSQLGGGSPIIRGFETNKVLMVVDGIRMNNAIYRGGHLQNIITLDNAIMDRVEIVYGPGSVVYGSDALGGVMAFTTKKPVLSTSDKTLVKANAFTRYMSAVSGYAAHADVSVGSKRFGSLTSFTYSNFGDLRQGANREPFVGNFGSRPWYVDRINGKDSIVKNTDTNLQVGSGYTQYDIMQKFMFKQNEFVNHTVNIQFSNSSNVDRYDRLTQLSGGLPKYAAWYYGPQKRVLAAYTIEISKKTKFYDNARIILGYQQIEESRIDRKLNKTGENHRIENLDILTVNMDFVKKSGKHEIRYGAEGWYNNVNSTAFSKDIITGTKTALDTRYASGGSTMQSVAVYGTHTWEISKKLILNDGLRFSNVGLNAQFTDTTFFNFPFKEANQRNSALNGNVGLIYMPTNDCRITTLFSTGFRAPNVDDLSKVFESTAGSINVPNPNLKPEYTYNGEVGISNTFGNWLTAQATGYYTLYTHALTTQNFTYNGKDSIMYAGTMSKVVATTNAAKANMYGLELSLNGTLNDHVSMYATYNYTHARIVTDSTAIPLDHIPPVFGKLGLKLTENKFQADLFVNYSAWKRIADYNPFGEDNEAYALPQGMPSWYTINARMTYQFNKNLGLQVACENILDRNYRVFASNISAPGRNFIVTLRGNF
jgi:hemoglobin/transferrin/lactoferrin receptor protein